VVEQDLPGPGTERAARIMTVLWPAFLMAGVLEMLVFALVDPHQLHGWGMDLSSWSASAVYTVTFLVFWAVISAASAISVWLGASPAAED
jgi:hypothetical protein